MFTYNHIMAKPHKNGVPIIWAVLYKELVWITYGFIILIHILQELVFTAYVSNWYATKCKCH